MSHGVILCLRGVTRFSFVIICLFMLASCAAQYPYNPALDPAEVPWEATRYDRLYDAVDDERPLIVVLAFSGGGTRAAALSYGTLEALRRVEYDGSDSSLTMLDHVSLITSVSGGSFTAAYYGLHGEGIFDDFRERFLLHNVQGDLVRNFLNPIQWPRLASPRFGRSDLAQEYYDRILFDGATMADMTGDDRPAVTILATDMVAGFAFPFIPDTFELICSDFASFPVSRAVVASSAFPGAFSPVILKNYAEKCQTEPPEWVVEALENPDPRNRTYQLATKANVYLGEEKQPYIYLLDGGLSDNLGLRTIIDKSMLRGGIRRIILESQWKASPRIVFIVVDAETRKNPPWTILGEIPGLRAVMGLSSTVIISKYNFETIDLLSRMIKTWEDEHTPESYAPEFYLVHMTFDRLANRDEREYFNNLPTTLALSETEVDRLRGIAARLLYSDEEFRRLLDETGGRIKPATGAYDEGAHISTQGEM